MTPAGPAAAQGAAAEILGIEEVRRDLPVTLLADAVSYDETARTLTASGDVEVFYGQTTLRAQSITYDAVSERITAEGPLALYDGDGTTLVADAAALDADLRDGVIEGAKALIAGGSGTAAAVEGRRIDGRYTALAKAVYSSCEVCLAKPTPLWSIRAERVVHDEQTRDVFYEDATFSILGVPVAWLPYFRHPDPSVRRRTGFLAPSFRNSSNYGVATKIPYFITLGPSHDATVTAFPTENDGPIIELEQRSRFDFGGYDLSGSMGLVDLGGAEGQSQELRGHLFGFGRFDLAEFGFASGTTAGFDIELTTDDGYLRRYDFSDEDRLTSEVFVDNYGARDFLHLAGVYFQSMRADEPSDQIPRILPEFSARREIDAPSVGGDLGFTASGVSLSRASGRDVTRLTLGTDWSRRTVLDGGLVLGGFASLRGDAYKTFDDPDFSDEIVTRFAPQAGVELRFPLIASGEGVTHLVEPGAMLVVAPDDLNDDDIPNEDSLLVEFDDTNVLEVNRFPGFDRIEGGQRLNLAVNYSRIADDGIGFDATVGRVIRLSEQNVFTAASGLEEQRSDWVAAWAVEVDPWLRLFNRFRIDDDATVARNEVGARAAWGPAALRGSYVFLAEDETAGALDDRSEVAIGADLDVTNQWRISGFVRRDIVEAEYVDAEAQVAFQNECAALEFYVERDFTSTENAPASTGFGLRVRLFGSADGAGRRSGVCGPVY